MYQLSAVGELELNPISWNNLTEDTMYAVTEKINDTAYSEHGISVDAKIIADTFDKGVNETDFAKFSISVEGFPKESLQVDAYKNNDTLSEYLTSVVIDACKKALNSFCIELNDLPFVFFKGGSKSVTIKCFND